MTGIYPINVFHMEMLQINKRWRGENFILQTTTNDERNLAKAPSLYKSRYISTVFVLVWYENE